MCKGVKNDIIPIENKSNKERDTNTEEEIIPKKKTKQFIAITPYPNNNSLMTSFCLYLRADIFQYLLIILIISLIFNKN